MKLAVCMVTMNRSPRKNYLGETLRNLQRAGVFRSEYLHSFDVSDSGSLNLNEFVLGEVPNEIWKTKFLLAATDKRLVARDNVAKALNMAGNAGAPWVVFIEDDIDVTDSFLENISDWLEDNAKEDRRVVSFGTPYDQVRYLFNHHTAVEWDYAVSAFYGTQCMALRREDALSFSRWLIEHPLVRGVDSPGAYDLMLQEWSEHTYPELKFFSAAVPSFVQHLGEESKIGNKFFTFPAFPGHAWRYISESSPVRVSV